MVVAAAWQWTGVGLAMLATTAVFVAMAAYVWRRRGGSAGAALALVLVALLLWAGTYAAELGATDLATISRWGDVKYVGLVLLPPAWFAFAALFAGRGSWVNGRNLALLAIHPLVVLLLLANAATHDLIRWYPPEAVADPDAVAEPGPLFWPHLVYSGVVMWGSLILMVAALVRASRVYRRVTTVLIVSLVVPYGFNLLYNFDVGPFGRVDLTPFLLIVSCLVLVWGLFRFRLLGIRPVARGPGVRDHLRGGAGARPAAPGGRRQPAGRAAPRPPPGRRHRPPAWPSCCPEAAEAVRDPPTASNGAAGAARGAGRDQGGGDPPLRADGGGHARPAGAADRLADGAARRHRAQADPAQPAPGRRAAPLPAGAGGDQPGAGAAPGRRRHPRRRHPGHGRRLPPAPGPRRPPARPQVHRAAGAAGRPPPPRASAGCASSCSSCARRCWTRSGWPRPSTSTPGGPASWPASPSRSPTSRPGSCRTSCGWWPTGSCRRRWPTCAPTPAPSRVAVRLEEVDGGVLARVSDDGAGFLPGLVERRPAGHLGLISMREQATMAGGWCRLASAPGMGTTVEAWLPRPEG